MTVSFFPLFFRTCSLQVLPNALKSSRGASSSARSSHKESTAAGKKRKLTTLEEIRLVGGYSRCKCIVIHEEKKI